MRERNLWVLGGTSGIGKAAFEGILNRHPKTFSDARAFGYEDFNIIYRTPIRKAVTECPPTDVIYSVGINRLDWIKDIRFFDFTEVMQANVYGLLNLIQVLQIEEIGPVNIVAVTSDAAWRPMRTSAVYCASKAAMEMAIRVASRELAPEGWRINGVAPGKVEDTPMTEYVDRVVPTLRGWTEEFAEEYERNSCPLGRKVTKSEVVGVIESVLFGPAAMTGEIVAVNGGR